MKFINAQYSYLLFLPVLVMLFYLWAFRKRQEALSHFIDKAFIKDLASRFDAGKWFFRAALIVAAVFFLAIAVMRPSWGFYWEEVRRKGLDILIAVDTSKSMLAEDVKPNRLERSKLAIKDLLKKLKGDRVGLIAFSGSAFLQCPLTVDYNGFGLALEDLSITSIPRGGTAIASAIRVAADSYRGGTKKYKVLIIITDGENLEGDALKEAEQAKRDGIRIFCIGIGTKEGDLIPVKDDTGKIVFLKDREGKVVKTRLDEELLKKIAITTGGSYVRQTPTEFGLELIYNAKLSKLEKEDLKSKMRKRYLDRYQLPLLAAVILIILELFISDRKRENARP